MPVAASEKSIEHGPHSQPKANFQRHIITCEFPPQPGGVSDYTRNVAVNLAATGEDIHVWCPDSEQRPQNLAGVTVHREFGGFSASQICRLDRALNLFRAPRQILVQWVPHGYGRRSLNLLFCLWVLKRAFVNKDRVQLMVHEAFLWFGEGGWRHTAAAFVHRIMISCLLASASKVWLATSAWEAPLKRYCFGRKIPFETIAIPSSIALHRNPDAVASIRHQLRGPNGVLLGHFGTYGPNIAAALRQVLPALLGYPDVYLALMGNGSLEFRSTVVASNPMWSEKIYATGSLEPPQLSHYIQACDLMMQPYPDGVTTRRTSAMVSLSHGRPLVTTVGSLTEEVWIKTQAVGLAAAGCHSEFIDKTLSLITDESERIRIGPAGAELYERCFDLSHTLAALGRD